MEFAMSDELSTLHECEVKKKQKKLPGFFMAGAID